MTQQESDAIRDTDIAIIGMACRFPGATDPRSFWHNIRDGVESITFADGAAAGMINAGGLLGDIDRFDAAFFGYSAREAELLDPQHRLFLECAWEALEDAGYDGSAYAGAVGVYGGTGPSSYLINNVHPGDWRPDRTLLDSSAEIQLLLAADKDFLTSRASYKLDLRGPSVNLQAACATSLFAVHFAAQGLLAGECELALAGAANVPVPQLASYRHEPGMVLSSDGHCRAFDAKADGTVFGSGVLKPLRDAVTDRDPIYAVIKGTAVNNDGALKVGMTAPGVHGQATVIEEALRVAEVDPRTVGYLEAHGTGTELGDPIEVEALTRAFGAGPAGSCALGSVKTNVGHLAWAAGMPGLIKTVLALHHRQIPPSLHFHEPNPKIDFAGSPFRVNTRLHDWPSPPGAPRRAGVNAFGLGGANAHVVLEEAPRLPAADDSDERTWQVLPLSARTPAALRELAGRYRDELAERPEQPLADIAHTASTGRRHHEYRGAVVAGDRARAISELDRLATRTSPTVGELAAPRVAMLFTGYWADIREVGRTLYSTASAFRTGLDACSEVYRELLGHSAAELLYGDPDGADPTGRLVRAQPAQFAVQMGLLSLWRSWGIEPEVVMGHSLGELAAACAAGVFDVAGGARLVVARARLLASLPKGGAMMAVDLDEERAREAITGEDGSVAIAALNGPSNTVLTGRADALRRVGARLRSAGVRVKDLGYGGAGHSPEVDGIAAEYERAAGQIPMRAPDIPIVSNLTGSLVDVDIQSAGYWRRQLREPVRFASGVRALAGHRIGAFVEVGPAPILLGMAGAVLADHPGRWLPSLRPGSDDWAELSAALGQLYELGADIDWQAVGGPGTRNRVHLPTYPFQRERHWIAAPEHTGASANQDGSELRALLHHPRWERVDGPPGPGRDTGHLLVLADRGGIGDAIAGELTAAGGTCLLVHRGPDFHFAAGEACVLDPNQPEHLERLLDAVPEPVGGIVQLWALDTPELADSPAALRAEPAGVAKAARDGCGTTLELIKALERRGVTATTLWLVTRDAHVVTGTDRALGVAQAPLWGLAKIAAMEHPELSFIRVDLGHAEDPASLAAGLLAELRGGDGEQEVALRGGMRYVRRLVPTEADGLEPAQLRADASYLVVGGLRGLGVLVAERMVTAGAGTLVLVGRGAPGADTLRRIERLRERGVTVVIESADIADPAAVGSLLDRIDRLDAPLRGIVHTAAVLEDGVLRALDWARFATVLAPKAQGAWNLHVLCRERAHALDFCCYFSSATVLIGNPGQANYAAANAFLDALAHHRVAGGLPAVSINWGAWSDTGFLSQHADTLAQVERSGMGSFPESVGAAALDRLMAGSRAQVGVLPTDWPIFLRWHGLETVPFFADLTERPNDADADAETVAGRVARATGDERRGLILAYVREQAGNLLGASGSSVMDDANHLVNHGLDSLTAIQLRNRLQAGLDSSLPTTLCFRYPSIAAITEHLDNEVLTGDWSARVTALAPLPRQTDAAGSQDARGPLPLSAQQRRWLRLRRLGYGRLVTPIMFHAPLDRHAFRAALRTVAGRHQVLRCRFDANGAYPLPVDDALPPDERLFVDLGHLDRPGRADALTELGREARETMPDPATSVPWAIRAVRLDAGRFLVLLSSQHLEFDGVSVSVFVDELRESYRRELAGEPPLAGQPPQYQEFVAWQADYLGSKAHEDRAFFAGLYTDSPGRTLLPGHSGTRGTESHQSGRITPTVHVKLWPRLRHAARQLNVSPFAVLCAVYLKLLTEVCGRQDITVGTIVTGRPDERFATTIGPFVAPFPLSVTNAGRPVAEVADLCNRLIAAINERSVYPPADLVSHVPPFTGLPEDTYYTDPFIMFNNYQREDAASLPRAEVLECLAPLADTELSGLDAPTLAEIAGLFLIIDIWEDEPRFNFWYHLHRFSAKQVTDWARRYLTMLGTALDELTGPDRMAA